MKTQTRHSPQEESNGFFLWLKLNSLLKWLKRTVVAMIIAGSLYVSVAQPFPLPAYAADYNVADYAALVAAIDAANLSPEDDTITLTGDITLGGNLPLIRSNITFEGNNHYVDGANAYRAFFVGRFDSAPTVAFRNLTIQNGKAQGGSGSGGGAGLGGGMFVYDGDVTVQNVTFANNAATGGAGNWGGWGSGGGGMGGNGGGQYAGGGGGLWAGATGGTGWAAPGGTAGNYGGGGAGHFSTTGGVGGGTGGGLGGQLSGGGGGLNGSNGGTYVGGNGGFGGGGGAGRAGNGGHGGVGGGGGYGYLGGHGGFGGGGSFGRISYYGDPYGGDGGFGGGGGVNGNGGFGGGNNGGGGAGFGGGLFVRAGTLTLQTVAFNSNSANHGTGASNGQGKGGGVFILHSATNPNGNNQGMPDTLPSVSTESCGVTFSGNTAQDDAGSSTDNDDIFGNLGNMTASCGIGLALTKSVTPEMSVALHSVVTYTVRLANTGIVSDTNVILTDTLPDLVDFGTWLERPDSGIVQNGNAITWTGTLTNQTAITLSFTAQHVGAYTDIVTNTAYFSGTEQVGNERAVFTVESAGPEMVVNALPLAAEVCLGAATSQEIQICNTGDAPLEWSITEAYRAGLTAGLTMSPSGIHSPMDYATSQAGMSPVNSAMSGIAIPERVQQPLSLSGSNVTFAPSAGGDTCYIPSAAQTFCFSLDSYTNDYAYLYNTWQRFPADWAVQNVYQVAGGCDNGGSMGGFAWNFETAPYELNLYTPAYHAPTDHCWRTYCVEAIPGGGGADALTSWYMSGDNYGEQPYHPCSSDGYTPSGQATCDEAIQPPASIPTCAMDFPWLGESPVSGTLSAGACQMVTVSFDGQSGGLHTADLKITSNDPVTPVVTLPVTLTVNTPVSGANFTWDPARPIPGEEITFSGTAAGDAPSYAWDFGDGTFGAGITTTHTYAQVGDYGVTFTATAACGYEAISYTVSVVPTTTLSVRVEGAGVVTPMTGVYPSGTAVWLEADPAPGWQFYGWEGGLTGRDNPAALLMAGDQEVTALFQPATAALREGIIALNNVKSNYYLIDPADDADYGPLLQDQLGTEGGGRFDVVVTPDGQTALISNFGDMAVFFVDITDALNPSVVATVTLPFFAEDIALSADGQYALVTDGGFSPVVASIHIPSATLVDVAELGTAYTNAVDVAPDGTVVMADFFGGVIHATLLGATGQFTYANPITYVNTYTPTYPGIPIAQTAEVARPVNIAIAPDGETVLVTNWLTSTVAVYQITAPGELTFAGVVPGLHGDYGEFFADTNPAVQSVVFNEAGDKAYAVVNNLRAHDTGANTGDRLGILNITGPGQVSLAAGGVVTLPHHTESALFGVDVMAVTQDKVYVGYPTVSSDDEPRPVAVVHLADYSVTMAMPYTSGVAVPTSLAVAPIRTELYLGISARQARPGQIITYTVEVVNPGFAIGQLTLQDVLPPEVEFVGPITLFPPTAGTVGTLPDLATALTVAGGDSVTVTFPVRVRTNAPLGAIVTNTVTIAGPTLMSPGEASQAFVIEPLEQVLHGPFIAGTWYPFTELCGGVYFTQTADVSVITVTLRYEYPTANFDGLPRRYDLALVGGGYTAALRLCYTDDELIAAGITAPETDLHAYHYIGGGAWVEHSQVDPVNNWVTAHNLTDLNGVWGLGVEGDAPTAVSLSTFSATSPVGWLVGLMVGVMGVGTIVWRRKW